MLKTRSLLFLILIAAVCVPLFTGVSERFLGSEPVFAADKEREPPPRGELTPASLRGHGPGVQPWTPIPRARPSPLWELQKTLSAPRVEKDPDAPVVDVNAAAASTPMYPGDLDPTIDVQITQEIIDKATELGSVEAMYEFVRNECAFQAYYGSQKGSVETLRQQAGNDYDLASLLIALLRASGIPSRYAVGMVEMPVDRATSWLAVDDGWVAGSILYTKGLEGLIIVSGDDVIAIRARRVWVEAYVPRGHGSRTWVPLDPAFALTTVQEGIDIPEEMGLDAQAFVDEYYDPTEPGVTLPRPETLLELLLQDITDYIDAHYPGLALADVIRAHEIVPEELGILPGSLPYTVRSRDMDFSEIPADRRYQIRFHLHDGGTDLIDHTLNLPEIAGKRITIDYVGATPGDEAIIESYGGIYQTPPALVDLKPVLRVEGTDAAVGATGVGMGLQHESDIHFLAPVNGQGLPQNVVPVIYNDIVCGVSQAIGLAIEGVSEGLLNPPLEEDLEGTAQLLYDTAMDYLANCRNAELELGQLMHAYVTNGVANAIVENVVTVTDNGFDWEGLRVDADRSVLGFWPVDRYDPPDPESKDFMILAGAEGSLYESRIYEDGYGQDAVSTIKILELSVDAGITIYKRWDHLPLPTNTQPAGVQEAIEDAIYYYGHVVTFPADPITVGAPETGEWTGTGWIDMDPNTGAAGYIISGHNAGGATYEYWPPEFIDLQAGDRRVVDVDIVITNPPNDSPDPPAVFRRHFLLAQRLTFEYQIDVTYDDESTATLGPYTRVTRNTTRSFVPGNYTFKVWLGVRIWFFSLTIDAAERDVSIVGVLIREDDGLGGVGEDPPKFIPVKPPDPGDPVPFVNLMALVIPETAPNGETLATAYSWTGGDKLSFTPNDARTTKLEPNSPDPSTNVNDQLVMVVVDVPGGVVYGVAEFRYPGRWPDFFPFDRPHTMTVYELEVKAEDGISDPPTHVCAGDSENLKAVLDPAGIAGSFEDWVTTSSKVTLSYPSPGPLGKDVVQVAAGDDPSDAVEDEEIAPNFKPDGASEFQQHAPHQMTVLKIDFDSPDENAVHLKGEEIRWRAELLPPLDPAPTWSFSYMEGTGDPSSGAGEEAGDYRDFSSTVTSEGTAKVKATITSGTISCEAERTIKTVVPEIIDVNFQSTACDLKSHMGNVTVSSDTKSEWKRTFGYANPSTNNDAAYPAEDVATCKIQCKAADSLSNATSVQVKADGTPEDLYAKGAIFSDWTGAIHMDGGSQLRDSMHQYVNDFDYTWYYRVETLAGPGNWGEWVEMNRNPTHHNISITKAAVTGTQYQWLVMNSCKLADGLTASTATDKDIVDQIYTNLPDLRSSNDFLITSADWAATNKLKYGVSGYSTQDILANKGGMCGGWFKFFQDLVAVQGVSAERRCYLLQNDAGQNPEAKWYSIIVHNAGLNQSQPTHPARSFKDVDSGKYPLPRYFGLTDPNDDITYSQNVRRYKFNAPDDGHCINFLVYSGKNYLYDACFGPWGASGIHENVYASVPLGTKNGAANNTFRQKYFNDGVPHLYGRIWFIYAADTQLEADLGQNDTTVTVASTADADSSGAIRIEDEIIRYTGKTATEFTGCSRGAYGTSKAAHNIWIPYAADTQLAGAIGENDTTITVDSTANAHSSGTIRIEDEIITYTGKTPTTFTGCSRGAHGTTKAAHADNTPVNLIERHNKAVKLIKTESGQNPPKNFCPVTSEVEEAGLNLEWVQ